MQFLCLAYGSEADWNKLTPAEQQALLAQDEVLRDRGTLMSAVQPTVTTVTAWDGTPHTRGAPFAQSRVPLAGFSLLEADDIDHAVRLVSQTPCARAGGAIEIRPLLVTGKVRGGHDRADTATSGEGS